MNVGLVKRAVRATLRAERYRWWHALLVGPVANAVSRIGSVDRAGDREYYEALRQAPFAPPSWAFAPVWAINNASVLWGYLRLLNLPEDTPNRRELLWLQGASWSVFSTFAYVYFRKRSPILAFVWTAAFSVLTVASAALSWRLDRRVALSFATLLAWLALATPTATYQMLHNPDELFGTPSWR